MAVVFHAQCAFVKIPSVSNSLCNIASYSGKLYRSLKLLRHYSNYGKSKFVERIGEKYAFRMDKDPVSWLYVERLMPFKNVPKVSITGIYVSGWIPPKETGKELPYFMQRTKNHLLPVYKKFTQHGPKYTVVKKLEGDIWLMNEDLKDFLNANNNTYIETNVRELAQQILIKGDYVQDVKVWAYSKGF